MLGEDTNKISLDVLMQRMSEHLDSLAARVFEIEDAVGKAITTDSAKTQDGVTITRLQSLDFLRQSLEDLALLSCFLSRHSKSIYEDNLSTEMLFDHLKLDTTRSIVSGSTSIEAASRIGNGGDLDLF